MAKNLTLSVAMCTYNGAQYVEEQLSSILNQELSIDEIVVCDDGSKDNTLDIVKRISEEHPEVKWNIQQNSPNLGVTKNFEKALSLCTGDIIFLSDQDDIWLLNKTKKIVNYLRAHPEVDLVFTDAALIDEHGQLKTSRTLFDACGMRQLKNVWMAGLQFEIENVIQRLLGATFGIRKSFVDRCLPFSTKIRNYHDGQLAMHSVVHGCNGMIDECLIKYRIHGNNVVGLGGESNWVFSQKRANDEFASLVEPRSINSFFLSSYADKIRKRVRFFQKRTLFYCSVKGKLLLALSVFQYIKYYRQYWWSFYFGDILYGVSSRFRKFAIKRYP